MFPSEFTRDAPLISAASLAEQLSHPRLRLVDCRFSLAEPQQAYVDYAAAHLPNAVYAHLERHLSGPLVPGVSGRHPLPNPADLSDRLGQWGIGNEDFVVVYDNTDGSMAAARLWWLLRWLGHEAVAVLDGGLSAWRAAGLPVTSDLPKLSPAQFIPHVQEAMTVTREQVDTLRLGSGVLLDARARERFRGDVEPIDKRAGHIPGARSLPFGKLVSNGRLSAAGTLRKEFTAVLEGADISRTVAYCGSGVTACVLLLAAESAGISGIRLYPGSFSEWIADGVQPVAVGD
jgi:thiosulfate/3-mercaptopyruvate sulfurtransferase